MRQLIEIATALMLLTGAAVCVGCAVRWMRSGAWRDPLADAVVPRDLTLLHAGLAILCYLVAANVLAAMFAVGPDASRTPGGSAWYRSLSVESAAKLLAALYMAWALRGRPRGPGIGRGLLIGLLAMLAILALSSPQLVMMHLLLRPIAPQETLPVHEVFEALTHNTWGTWGLVELVLVAVVVAPLAEELFFRGVLLQALVGHLGHAWLAVSLSGFLFGLMHAERAQDVLPLFTMGVVLGFVRLRYGSLTACVAAHGLFNGRSMAIALLCPEMIHEPF